MRLCRKVFCIFVFMMLFSHVVFANVPEIIIDGIVVQEKMEHPIITSCKKFQSQLELDKQCGVWWTYHNPKKYVEEVFDNALATGKRGCNCALLARWALRDAGYLNADEGFFYGDDDGSIHASHRAMEELTSVCDFYHVDGMKTVSDLASCGELQAGDIVVLKTGVGHTFVYAGDGMAYDGGHAYTHGGSGEGAVFDSFYGPCTAWNSRVGYIIRTKNMAESIQIETIYVPPIVVESVDEVVKEPVFFVLNRRILQ